MKNRKFPDWVVLTIICCIAGVLIAAVNFITKDTIAAQQQKQLLEACQCLIPGATEFNDKNVDGFSFYEGQDQTGNVIGYVAVNTVSGFGGEIEITTGAGVDGVLTGIQVGGANFAETAGLGAKAKEPEFLDQFAGKKYPIALTKDGGEIDAITSATITSRAVTGGVNAALEKLTEVGCFGEDAAAPAEAE